MVISKSMEALVAGSSTIRKLFEEGLQLAAEVGAENVYDFSLGNPASPVPAKVTESIKDILAENPDSYVHGYMKNAGFDEVRANVAESLNKRFNMGYDAGDIVMTVGAAGAMNCIFRALIETDDEVIAFAPYFGEYRNYAANYGGKLVVVPPDMENFDLNINELDALINPKTKCIIINNPNNPSGRIFPEETIRQLGAIIESAEKRIGHPIYVLADEPYRELVYDNEVVPYIPSIIKNSIYIYSFSKTLSLPGERIGYMALSKKMDCYDEMINAMAVANRCLGYVNAPSLFQLVVSRCLDEGVDLDFYDRNRKLLYDKLTSLGFKVVKPQGAFYLLVKAPMEDEEEFVSLAKKHHIILVSTKSFGCPGYIRMAYCVDYEMIKRSIPAFEALAKECGL
ncbi:MAG: pyridoxal phosphate-dependent aminotransferase [Pseudobutyrivibrio sp.]|uniref:pyridoxal phosphate-dependent aminotransferase n=1 Tax=Pseudobutyrivibrio sp. TaxID=2014367 RepID=UPI001B593429|nr:pyridoxal phosphate-dependent aminotransferase [Pseudobutyrivibrio sp.]MBP5325416.1 pyridoxal phosphate-dependent aminotransferase [Pseudobutyrivibrio sp.]MBR5648127.1 pyridoxal phosphate-dependent aminotransferase [Pseudobutyrivibrio sp.]